MTTHAVHASWRWLQTAGALLAAAAALEYGVATRVVEAMSELSLVSDISPWILVMAACLELLSLAAYTGLTQRLMGSSALGFGVQARIDLVGYGSSHVLPGGGAAAAALRFRLMVARDVTEPAAASLAAVQAVFAVVGLVAAWALGSALALPRTGSVATAVLLAGLAVLAVVVPGLVAAGAAAGPAVLGVLTWRLLQFWLPIPLAPVCWLSLELGRRSDRSGRTDDPVPKAR